MLLGAAIERLSGDELDQHVQDHVTHPIKAHPLCYLPVGEDGARRASLFDRGIAPTEWDPWRNRLLCGEVHDENAAVLGGVAGHAGLFGTVEGVLGVTGEWLAGSLRQPSVLNPDLVHECSRRQNDVPGSSWALGWDTPSSPSSSGRHFSCQSFGHLGYTGTSVWIDPACELEVVLLSNRVHPSRKNGKIRAFRPFIHDLVYQECVG